MKEVDKLIFLLWYWIKSCSGRLAPMHLGIDKQCNYRHKVDQRRARLGVGLMTGKLANLESSNSCLTLYALLQS